MAGAAFGDVVGHFSWQGQHLVMSECHFSGATCRKFWEIAGEYLVKLEADSCCSAHCQ